MIALCEALKTRLAEAQITQIQLADAVVAQTVAYRTAMDENVETLCDRDEQRLFGVTVDIPKLESRPGALQVAWARLFEALVAGLTKALATTDASGQAQRGIQ